MSAYVVSKETIDVIVYGMNKFDFAFEYGHERLSNPFDAAEKNFIGEVLWNLNREAAGDTWKDDIYDYHVPAEQYRDLTTLYGCLKCYSYQISDLHTFHGFRGEQIKATIERMKENIVEYLLRERDGKEIPYGI